MKHSRSPFGKSLVACLVFLTLLSIFCTLERHLSLIQSRRDQESLRQTLQRLKKELEDVREGLELKGKIKSMSYSCDKEVDEATSKFKNDVKSLEGKLKEGANEACKARLDEVSSEMDKLQKAFDNQMVEKVKMAQMMIACEGSPLWNQTVMTSDAVRAAQETVQKCGKHSEAYASQVTSISKGNKLYYCTASKDKLKQYLKYTVRESCPDDWYFVQELIYSDNCHSLPKRHCFARTASSGKEPLPLPRSLWDQHALIDQNVRWDLHQYNSFEAITRRKQGDCRNCFNLTLEASRWFKERHGTIRLEKVVKMKKGSLRIGLDIGGGTGSFAAKMAFFNCTILTTAMNTETLGKSRKAGLPYMETIALRGLFPLFLPHKSRLPFFDNTLDIIHNMNSIKYFSIEEFEELLFEWDRVLRPGGIWWFELFYAPVKEMPLFVAVLELFGYRKLYWNMSPKVDAPERSGEHVYLNCVLEKPYRG